MRLWSALVFAVLGSAAWAQEPRITISADQEEVVVGQPYLLRVEVLVPTFMPSAPVFPTFEMPGLIVRLPERSTTPISEAVDGDTWSGVRRTYRIYPTRAGVTEIGPQTLSIVYKDTETNEDVPLVVDVPATQVRARVPPGAQGLDPLIIAQDITVDQTWQVADGVLAVGDAVVRTLDISVSGTSALFVPPLLEMAEPQADATPSGGAADETPDATGAPPFLAYPEDAKVTEKIERGAMSGTRAEQVSYIAQAGGMAVFPDITLRWYNLDSDSVEEITLEGRRVEVAMPPITRAPLDVRALMGWGLLVLSGLGAVWLLHRFVWPPVLAAVRRIRMQYGATANAAHRVALGCVRAQDLNGLLAALDTRARLGCPPGQPLTQAISALTRSIYRDATDTGGSAPHWQAIARALKAERPDLFAPREGGPQDALPALNPFTGGPAPIVYFQTAPKE